MSNKERSMDSFVSNVVEKPQVFFTSNQKIVDSALEMAKFFYDNVKKVEPVEFSPFNELLTEGFDNDQIWEEITAQNEPFLDYAKTTLKTLQNKSFTDDDSEQEASLSEDQDVEMEEMDFDLPSQDEDMDQDSELDQEEEIEEEQEEEQDEENEEEEEDDEEDIPRKTSEVDDDFFNLEEFNKWTDEQEQLDMMSDREEDDDDFDFDNDLEEEEEDDEQDDIVDAAEMTYEDFFGSKKKVKAKKPYIPKKSVTINEEENQEFEDDASEGSVRNLFEEEEEEEEEGEKSAFEKQQERIQQQIEEFEDENIQDRHWTLRGEATAKARPVNSLLEEDLEFEHANKPVPVITQESTNTLEEMIKKRILDNMFDDVERKVDPTLKPFVPSKRVELADEKSKKSLAELYEDDFVRQQSGDQHKDARDEALEKEHEDIDEMFKNLCYKLDALSNFHYTPKAAKPEMTIVSNSAAISMEEIIPVNVSEATLLAPEEVYEKKRGDVKTAEEMDQAERKRVRAQKKKLKRKERDMKEKELKIMQKYNPQIGEKQAKKKAVKELLSQKNVTVIGKDGEKKSTSKSVTSASLF